MFCKNCGVENASGSMFCKSCGQLLENPTEKVEQVITNEVEEVEQVVQNKAEEVQQAVQNKAEEVQQAVQNKAEEVEQAIQNKAEKVEQTAQNVTEENMSRPIVQKAEKVKKEGKNKKSKKGIIIGAIAGGVALIALIIVLICVLVSNAKTIKIDEYITLETEGYDGYGTANATIDWKRIEKKYGDKIELTSKAKKKYGGIFSGVEPVDVLKEFVKVEIDKTSDLSNGDKVKYTVKINKDLDKYVECKIKVKNGTKTVSKLEKVGKFDPFEDLTVTFKGISPNGSLEYEYSGEQLGYYDFSFNETYGLKNGDKVKVTISNDMEYYAEQYGEIPEKTEMEYEVTGLDEYVNSYSKMTDEYISELKEEAEDTIQSYVANSYDTASALTDLEYSGYVFNSVKDEDSYYNFNNIYIIYAGTVSDSEGEFASTKVYYPVKFTNILSKEDEFSYNENDGISGNSYLGDSWHRTKGYVNPLTCYINIAGDSENYKTEAGDDFEKYADYETVTGLKDVSDEYKKTLADDAVKRIEAYIAEGYNGGSVATDLKSVGEYFMVAKEQGKNLEYNNKYVVVCSATVSNSEGRFPTTTVYFPVEYDGLAKLPEDEYLYTSVKDILGYSSLPDSWYSTKGYIDGKEMFSKVVTANREDYKYEVSESLKQFGE
ncbi:MAG: zinc ribbon domain-containing protein [Lachnospiraceae bacterium]|nr:zinc ribbon domain-containing protein [Lachnospiraceae bacterium]